jgi:ligand-binding sensor domain-containing protein
VASLRACLLAVLCYAAAAPPCAAVGPETPLRQLAIETWRTEQGLPQNTVPALAQTRDGYLWAGTQEGLARFDGMRFVVFDGANTPGLGHDTVWRLLADRAGRLWIGTVGGGLTRLDETGFRRFAEAEAACGSGRKRPVCCGWPPGRRSASRRC